MISVHVMVLNWKLAHSLSIKIKHLKYDLKCRLICMKQSRTQKWIG
jgi:hypothetical protein